MVHQRICPIMQLFLDRRLIPDSAMTRFRGAIASALRLRNSVIAELLLIAFVYVLGVTIVWRQYVALGTATWYATPSSGGTTLTLAGIWYGYLRLPLVFPRADLDAAAVAYIAHRPETASPASGSRGWAGVCLECAIPPPSRPSRGCARRAACGNADQPHLLRRCRVDRLQGRDRRRRGLHAVPNARTAAGVRATARAGEAHGNGPLRDTGRTLCPCVRYEMARRRRACR